MVDRMCIGKCWLIQDGIKARTNGERVFWDRLWDSANMENPGSANSMSNRDTISDKEVLATMTGFQYQGSQRSLYLELLKSQTYPTTCSPISPQDIKNQDPNPSFTWPTTGTSTVFKVKCSSTGKVALSQTWWT